MKLYSHPVSPYARKARVIAHELNLKLTEIDLVARGNAELRRINPLGKIPALVLDDGSVLIDSPVICEYLNHLGGGKFFPGMNIWRQDSGRWKALGLQALADGICDAALARVYEGRLPPERQNREMMDYNVQILLSGLDALERGKFAETPTIGEIAVGCALGYLEFRLPEIDWRGGRPVLAAWYGKFSQFPSMLATAPHA